MRRVALLHVCGAVGLIAFAGCEALPEQPPSPVGVTPSGLAAASIQRASRFLPIEDGRALFTNDQGFRVLDLRDPAHPRVEGSYDITNYDLVLYRADADHVLLFGQSIYGYQGERDDLDLRGYENAALFNIDIHDRAHPTLVDELVRNNPPAFHLLRQSAEGSALLTADSVWDGERYNSRWTRLELLDGRLVPTGEVRMDGLARQISATPEWLVVWTETGVSGNPRVTALDITDGELTAPFSAPLTGATQYPRLAIDGDRLRVAYEPAQYSAAIDTFDLRRTGVAARTGRCELGGSLPNPPYLESDVLQFSTNQPALYLTSSSQLERLMLEATGACSERRGYGESSRSVALYEPGPERLLGLGPNALTLYDPSPAADPALLVRAPLATRYLGTRAERPIQQLPLLTPSAAEDGSEEPWLIGVQYYGVEPIGRFQLLTMSDHTLTPRASLSTRGYPQLIAGFGDSLATVSTSTLQTWDASDLDAPRELARFELDDDFVASFALGEYVARVRYNDWYSPEGLPIRNDLQILRRGDTTPIASLPVETEGAWHLTGDVLVNFRFQLVNWSDRLTNVCIQLYDLRDPSQPRSAGLFTTNGIGGRYSGSARWPYVDFYYLVVGPALVFPRFIHYLGQLGTAFDVVDVRDPDRPSLVPSGFTMAGDDFRRHGFFVSGSKLYISEMREGTLYGSTIDFSDPTRPLHGVRRPVPGDVVAVTDDAVYTRAAWASGFTLAKISWSTDTSQLLAAHTWQTGVLSEVLQDDRGHVLFLRSPDPAAPPNPEPRANWVRLEILDAETLTSVSSLPIDSSAWGLRLVEGELLVNLSGATLRIDTLDPANPKLQLASPR